MKSLFNLCQLIPHRDDLAGTDTYGVYESNPVSSSFFSVPFAVNASTRIALVTGDKAHYVVGMHGNMTIRTSLIGSTALFSAASTAQRLFSVPLMRDTHVLAVTTTYLHRGPTQPQDPSIPIANMASSTIYRLWNRSSVTRYLTCEQRRPAQRATRRFWPTEAPMSLFTTQCCVHVWVSRWDSSRSHGPSAVCPSGCINGACISYNTCGCDQGWSGPRCEIRLF
jgi:hypothetical protein